MLEMLDTFYVDINGTVIESQEAFLSLNNRSFRYGDGVFETIRYANGKIQLLDKHIERLKQAMKLLGFEKNTRLTENNLRQQILKLIEKNKIEDRGARIRLTVYRKDGGFYTPVSNECEFVIECAPLDNASYALNKNGLTIDIFQEYRKSIDKLSNMKSCNALLYVLASVFAKNNQLDDAIMLNKNLTITESSNANIFAVKNGVLYTPPLSDGCIDGVMRSHIIELARRQKISVYEVSLAMNVLLNSDELFLTNAISGIKWIGAYKTKRFYNNMSKILIEKLNETIV